MRYKTLKDAIKIVDKLAERSLVIDNDPAAWGFLWRVTQRLTEQLKEEFDLITKEPAKKNKPWYKFW